MIKKLKTRFIILAMVSLALLLAFIVAGMNIINYRKVVSDADSRLDVLEENSARLLARPQGGDMGEDGMPHAPFDGFDNGGNAEAGDDGNGSGQGDRGPDEFYGRGGRGGPSMSRDEAEESRFFFVITDEDGDVAETNIDRIAAVDSSEAGEYAKTALASGEDRGFVDEYRYSVSVNGSGKKIMFLDCGRVLDSFRDFLRASILMSLVGLLVVFAVICYFAGRIVRPVAESYEKQKRFITDAGHEIKTPLAIIKANLDLLGMELDGMESRPDAAGVTDDLRDGLREIDGQVDRLTGLTNDLVYLSRMEEGGNSLVMTDVPLSDIADDSISAFVPLAREKGKVIIADTAPSVTVKGSTKELEKLMSILLENAIKYSKEVCAPVDRDGEGGMPAPPEIRVTLRREGKNAVLEVSNDTETELSNEMLSHVFERFYRTDSSRNSQTGGHGIGLSMASAIVSAHGGKISARTTDGHDFIVTASIPLA